MTEKPAAHAIHYPCSKCGVAADERCRTVTTRRTTDMHADRWKAPIAALRAWIAEAKA